jgi:hypothetical protein
MDGEGAGFRPRAGSTAMLFLVREVPVAEMLPTLAELATGVRVAVAPPPPRRPEPDEGEIDPDAQLGITSAGRELVNVIGVFTSWVRQCPAGPMDFDLGARPSAQALLGGWAPAVVHAFAAEPLTVAEASERVGVLGPDVTAERVEAMAEHGLLEVRSRGAEPSYAASDWLRRGIAPIVAAMRMDGIHALAGDPAPVAVADVEAVFRLALPLLRLPAEAAGSCALAVGLEPEVAEEPVGVTVRVEEGRVASLEPGVDPGADAMASAPAVDWLDTLVEIDVDRVQKTGNHRLAGLLVEELHETLFGRPLRAVFGDPSEW